MCTFFFSRSTLSSGINVFPLALLQANGVAPPPARESDVKANAIKHDSDETSKKIEDTEAKIAKLQVKILSGPFLHGGAYKCVW